MSSCSICGLVQGNAKAKILYSDDLCIAYLKSMPASPGHMILVPKNHYTIFEQVPNNEITHLFNVANKLSKVAFETFGRGGTNIIIQNGEPAGQTQPHLTIEIIPRNESDGLNFLWQPRQLSEEEMSTVELILKEEASKISLKEEKKKEIKEEKKAETLKEDGKDNYLFKSLVRIP